MEVSDATFFISKLRNEVCQTAYQFPKSLSRTKTMGEKLVITLKSRFTRCTIIIGITSRDMKGKRRTKTKALSTFSRGDNYR